MTGHNILLAGFGGQGILFTGKVIAYAGLMEGMEVSWLPSYGPEMRGGTANCSVCLSDDPIGSPLVTEPDILVAMNLPSLEKFENDVVPGGLIIVDSSIITKKVARDDVKVIYLPASEIAEKAGIKGAANMVILGKLFKETAFCTPENLDKGLQKTIPAKKMDLLDKNRLCIRLGTENRFQTPGVIPRLHSYLLHAHVPEHQKNLPMKPLAFLIGSFMTGSTTRLPWPITNTALSGFSGLGTKCLSNLSGSSL